MTTAPLSPQEREDILRCLNRTAREMFPGLTVPIESVAWASAHHRTDPPWRLDQLPRSLVKLIQRRCADRGRLPKGGLCVLESAKGQRMLLKALMRCLYRRNRHPERLASHLSQSLVPALEEFRRIDLDNFRTLCARVVLSRAECCSCVELMLGLAEAISGTSGQPEAAFIELALLRRNASTWPALLSPSEVLAVRQVLDVAKKTDTLDPSSLAGWALRIGYFDMVEGLIDDDPKGTDSGCSIIRFNTVASKLEGLVLYLRGYLGNYLDGLEDHERCHGLEDVPLSELRTLVDCFFRVSVLLSNGCDTKRAFRAASLPQHLWHSFDLAKMYLAYRRNEYAGLGVLLTALFYLERSFHDSSLGIRLRERIQRWLCYRTCYNRRYDDSESPLESEEISRCELLIEAIRSWNERDGLDPEGLLKQTRSLLDREPASPDYSNRVQRRAPD